MGSNLQAALDYAGRGYSVIPVGRDKRSYISWTDFQKRCARVEEIRAWWTKWPGAMIGIVTGEVSGVLVIDCDTREAYESVQKLLPDALLLPIAKTPRGWHLWFQYPKGSGITVGTNIMPGVDFRGEGGYIIAPPSINAEGKHYTWQEGLSLDEVAPAPASVSLFNILAVNIEGCGQRKPQETTKTTSDHNYFTEGHRDNDLFHAANCLIKGGCEIPFAKQVLDILAINSNPPFPKNEIRAKIDSALKRAERRERNIAAEVREWVETTTGYFETTTNHKELQLTTKEEIRAANMALLRLCEGPEPILEKHGNRRGCYRRIETDLNPVNFLSAPTDEFPVNWPLEIEELCSLYPGNIVIVAGSKSAGKTAFLLNVVRMNQHRHDIVYLNSEMGDTEFRKRLELFEKTPLSFWKFRPYHRAGNFADLITPERKIFIIDFLEIHDEFWKVAKMIQEIHKKMKDGICIIALQKAEGKDDGRGGDFSKEKARLYLSLDYLADQKVNRIKITDAKAWRTGRNPRGLHRTYKLFGGSKFEATSEWTE
ncbi:MAG: hypothetical protein CVU61_09535 [Deltaproteobacteria bacterium HGW-Deltaproteobacteria-19]|jgi:hypothetical protein|nr:MAG: hypothetical protein CVU61_09535 [Deltaproteobacteria bacterium HGW-Deltaproteobacteria-19]